MIVCPFEMLNTVIVYELDKPTLNIELSKASNIHEHEDIVIKGHL